MGSDVSTLLRDIHTPVRLDVGLLSLSAWSVLTLVLLLSCVAFLLYWHKSAYKREALRYFGVIEANYAKNKNAQEALAALNELFRRVCLYRFPKEKKLFSALTGRAWFDYLNGCVTHGGSLNKEKNKSFENKVSENPIFCDQAIRVFEEGLYRQEATCDCKIAFKASQQWILSHPWRGS